MSFIFLSVCMRRFLGRVVRDAGPEFCDGTAVASGVYERERRPGGLHRARQPPADGRLAGGGRREYNEHPRHQARLGQRNDTLSRLRGGGLPAGRPLGHIQVLGRQQRRRGR